MPRIAQLEGRDHWVIPVVMLTVGVHRGSNGPLLYTANELHRSQYHWNGRPITMGHPTTGANDPSVLNASKVGTVFNSRFDGRRLLADAWIDVERVQLIDDRVLQAIINNQQMELSTGVFTDNVDKPGTWNGKDYIAVATNYRPDHLALLVDTKGACSINDGCGFQRNAEEIGFFTFA